MTLIQRITAWIQAVGTDVKARPEVIYANTFAGPGGVQAALNNRPVKTTPCTVIVLADETTLDAGGNPQRVTYWYDASVLLYTAYARADGSITVAGTDGLGTMPPVADNAALLAVGTVYRDTLIKVAIDANNAGNAGFYIKEQNGTIHRVATYPI